MKRILMAGAAVAAFCGIASAADLPAQAYKAPAVVAPVWSWTGFYLGVYGGYGWGNLPNGSFTGGDLNFGGGIAGGTIGYNYQFPGSPLVVGVEVDGGWANITADDNFAAAGVALTGHSEISATVTARARIGYAFDRTMVYATGGGAWMHNKLTFTLTAPAFGLAGSVSDSKDHTGFAVGGGVEHAFTEHWTGKIEYIYMGFGSENYFAGLLPSGDVNVHTIKAGLNYKF